MKDQDGLQIISDGSLVSIIMNCYNSETYLREAIDSILAQTYQNWELVFWDNQSTDDSAEIVQSYVDSRIKYHCSGSFTPLGEARNRAIKESSGELIAFLDCDDLWMPEKLAQQVPLFDAPNIGLVICDTYFFNEQGIQKQLYSNKKPPVGMVFREILGEYFISLETAVIRRNALDSLEHWFDSRFNAIEEYDLFVRLSYRWHLAYADVVLAKWRVHASSWTWSHSHLFPEERRLMLCELEKLIPNFNQIYEREVYAITRTCAFEDAQLAWKAKKNNEARLLLKPYRTTGLKWYLLYCMTFAPYSLFHVVNRLKGGVQPQIE